MTEITKGLFLRNSGNGSTIDPWAPAVRWLEQIQVRGSGPTWEHTIPISGPADASRLVVGIACKEMPTDGFIAYYVPGSDAENTITWPAPPLEREPIYAPNMCVMVPVSWPENFNTSMTIRYWQGTTVAPPDASVSPVIATEVEDDSGDLDTEVHDSPALGAPPRSERVRTLAAVVLSFS